MSLVEEVPTGTEGVDIPTPVRSVTLLARSLRLWRTRLGLLFVLALVVIALLGPWVAPHAPDEFVGIPNAGPGGDAGPFGTDYLGQDVLSRFLYGGRSILFMAAIGTSLGVVVGVVIGLVAAYWRNALDEVLMRSVDVIMAFPSIVLALVLVTVVGPRTWVIILAIALAMAPGVARVARGACLPVVERDFVGAAEAVGVSRVRILFGELLPNIVGPIMVEASLRLTYSVGLIAALAYLGLSADQTGANWGTMIRENQLALNSQPWGALLPIIAIALLTMGTGLIGDGIARTAAGLDRERGDE